MSRKAKQEAPETTPEELAQAEATKPRPVDENGYTLDAWGLPLNGPARARVLGDLPDPAIDEAAWRAAVEAGKAPTVTSSAPPAMPGADGQEG